MARVDKAAILKTIRKSLSSDGHYGEVKYFSPRWIVKRGNHSRYAVNKVVKSLVQEGLCRYITIGGGCDEYGDPCPPWNGYELTSNGLKMLSSHEWLKPR